GIVALRAISARRSGKSTVCLERIERECLWPVLTEYRGEVGPGAVLRLVGQRLIRADKQRNSGLGEDHRRPQRRGAGYGRLALRKREPAGHRRTHPFLPG